MHYNWLKSIRPIRVISRLGQVHDTILILDNNTGVVSFSSSLHPVSVFLCSSFSLSLGVSFSLKLCYFLLCLLLF